MTAHLDLTRLPDWEEWLATMLADWQGVAFAWGKHDCLMFAAAAIEAVTGVDPGKGHRGKYRSQASAFRHLGKLGATSVPAYLDSLFPATVPALARRGDLVVDHDGNAGVCIGAVALFVGEEGGAPGLLRVPLSGWAGAWVIG